MRRHKEQLKKEAEAIIKKKQQMPVKKKVVQYRSIYDLNKSVKVLIDKLPTDIDLVVGIPRCGMLPATLLSIYWNLPLADVYSLAKRCLYKHFVYPDKYDISNIKKVLVIDDSIASGHNIGKAKQLLKGLPYQFVYAAVYASNMSKHLVDYYAEIVPQPRMFEYDITLNKALGRGCVDIDGVLCRNPTKEEQSTPESLSHFYKTVQPWIRPPWVDTLVTGRLEQYRPETEAWLEQYGIKYKKLIMLPEQGDHGAFKAQYYKNSDRQVFIESSLKEAKIIERVGKQVIVPYPDMPKLKMTAHISVMPRPAGASISFCTIAAALAKRGHDVWIPRSVDELPYMPEDAYSIAKPADIRGLYKSSDIILVHWRSATESVNLTKQIPKPRVHFFCDGGSHTRLGVKDAALTVYNAKWLMDSDGWNGEKMVVYPPVFPELFATDRGDGILLVASHKEKGIELFLALAKQMPDRKFVLAKGRGKPILRLPPNIEIIDNTPDSRDIYSKSRIVLMPSRMVMMQLGGQKRNAKWVEGYGRVAIEAAASGIPTIGSRESQGLRECLGEGGMFAGQDNIKEWIDLIEKLDNKDFYAEKSEYALQLSSLRHPDKQINELEERIVDICNRA